MNVFICAGDPSGDIHAANLALAIKKSRPGVLITALGGHKLERVCDKFLCNLVNLGGFGFWQPVKLYFILKKILKDTVIAGWSATKPDRVILVDYYGFNIFVAEEAFKRGIPVYYYISPQVWATRAGRIKKIAKYVKKMLVVLPFEEKLYRDAGVDAVFTGHPLLDMVPDPAAFPVPDRAKNVIGLFPGSRLNVYKRHIGLLLEAARLIGEKTNAEFRIFCAPDLATTCINMPYPVIVENSYEERMKISFAITTSGTVSLENALLGVPMVVYYKLSRFNFLIAKMLAKVKYITMVNILLDTMLVPELLQGDATPLKIAEQALNVMNNDVTMSVTRKKLLSLRPMLGQSGASERAANIIMG